MHLRFPKRWVHQKKLGVTPIGYQTLAPSGARAPVSLVLQCVYRKKMVWHPFGARHWHPVARMPLCVPEKGVHPKCREENSMSFHVTLLQMLKLVGMRHCWQMVQTWTWWKCQLLTNLWNVENKFKGFSSSQKPTNHLPNQVQISSQHQVPKTWVKQHPKTPQPTKTNENPSPSSSMHKLVSNWFLLGSYGSDCSYQLYKGSYYVHMHMHCSKIGLDVQVGSR